MTDGLTWTGFSPDDFIDELEQATTLTRRESKKALRAGANRIMSDSKAMAPVDKHNLENAHHIEDIRLSQDNMTLEIQVGGMQGGRDVDDYAWIMEEGLTAKGEAYKLGKLSQIKNDSNPANLSVGPKFLERAIDMHVDDLMEEISNSLLPDGET